MKLRTIAIDDEPLALQLVSGFIERTPFLELVGAYENPLPAIEKYNENDIDLVFLDIQMPDITGIAFAKMLGSRTKIVFTTAYENYAVDGFRLQAVDYLLKPFGYDDFLQSAQRAKNRIDMETSPGKESEEDSHFLFLKSDYKIRRINFSDILYIEGLKEYVRVFLVNESKPVLSISTLKNIESKLPCNSFMRVHRSFIVNLGHVKTIERSRIQFGKIEIPISDQYKEKFQEYLNRNIL